MYEMYNHLQLWKWQRLWERQNCSKASDALPKVQLFGELCFPTPKWGSAGLQVPKLPFPFESHEGIMDPLFPCLHLTVTRYFNAPHQSTFAHAKLDSTKAQNKYQTADFGPPYPNGYVPQNLIDTLKHSLWWHLNAHMYNSFYFASAFIAICSN